jgi:hypothetical protein
MLKGLFDVILINVSLLKSTFVCTLCILQPHLFFLFKIELFTDFRHKYYNTVQNSNFFSSFLDPSFMPKILICKGPNSEK